MINKPRAQIQHLEQGNYITLVIYLNLTILSARQILNKVFVGIYLKFEAKRMHQHPPKENKFPIEDTEQQ